MSSIGGSEGHTHAEGEHRIGIRHGGALRARDKVLPGNLQKDCETSVYH